LLHTFRNLVVLCLFLYSTFSNADADLSALKKVSRDIDNLKLTPIHLNFSAFWAEMTLRDGRESAEKITELNSRISTLNGNDDKLPLCLQVELNSSMVKFHLVNERTKLLAQMPKDKSEWAYLGSISKFPNGRQWYLHLLKSWLLDDVTIRDLENIARNELTQVEIKTKALANSTKKENTYQYQSDDHFGILQAFRQREQKVYEKLEQVFATDFVASKVRIERSTLPKDFPAPGIYDNWNKAFIYHLQSERFPAKHMDWLYLHEAVPGHHYQSEYVQQRGECDA